MEQTKETTKPIHIWPKAFNKTEYLRKLVSKEEGHRVTKAIAVGIAIEMLIETLAAKYPDVIDDSPKE